MEYYYKRMFSPVGLLRLIAHDDGLTAVLWEHDTPGRAEGDDVAALRDDHPMLLQAEKQLREYFRGAREQFDLPLSFAGTSFQQQVWQALLTIPFGVTRTYGEMARQVGSGCGGRAIGGAVNKNPIAIIAPCHRVIGATGKLVGFAGGLENKAILLKLEHEKRNPSLWGI
jgi:methylated-DNA-[protein]-cysteine S-methyltransferase